MSRLSQEVLWWPTSDPARPWAVRRGEEDWEVAITETIGEPRRYTLFINGRRTEEFLHWPPNWTIAPEDAANASQRAEYEHELEYFEKNKDVLPIDESDLDDNGTNWSER